MVHAGLLWLTSKERTILQQEKTNCHEDKLKAFENDRVWCLLLQKPKFTPLVSVRRQAEQLRTDYIGLRDQTKLTDHEFRFLF